MIEHDRALELGAAALDAALATDEAADLATHLETCPSCPAVIEAMRADARAIGELPAFPVDAALRDRIVAAAAAAAAAAGPDAAADAATSPVPDEPDLRPQRLPVAWRRPAVLTAAAAIVVAIVGGTLAWNAAQGLGDIAGVGPTSRPSSRPDATPGPTPDATVGPPPAVTAWHPVADLVASVTTGGEVDVATTFRLASVDGTPAAVLAQRVSVQPPVQLAISTEVGGEVTLTPSEPLTPGATYRFTLRGEAGETLDTWAFQANQPLQVVGTVPGDEETDVPLDTGIEIVFDQDGVVDAESHVTIEPATTGRFETHDRTLVFVPDRLVPATVYTVTVRRGIAVPATGETLESDVTFQFETSAARTSDTPVSYLRFAADVFESGTAARPTIALWSYVEGDVSSEDELEIPDRTRLELYRLADRAAAIKAFQDIRALPRWSQWNAAERLPTDGLRRVAAFEARLEEYQRTLWTALPEALPAGWYLVEVPSPTRPAQAVLQVTDVSAYLVVSDTQTLVWANDVATGRALVGATVRAEGSTLGTTGADGTLLADTPSVLLPDRDCGDTCAPVITVQAGGRSAFLPATGARDPDGGDPGGHQDWRWYEDGDATYWRVFASDRTLYRRTDTVNVWGALRDRDSGIVPRDASVRLVTDGFAADQPAPAVARAGVTMRPSGAFTGSLALDDVPEGYYRLQLLVAGDVVAERQITVDRIVKPAYQLDVTTGHHVYVQGDNIRVTATATFFDGTPVPGVDLRISGAVDAEPSTDATGTAIVRTIAAVGDDQATSGEPDYQVAFANPARAEEGEISGASRQFVVFPSHWTMTAEGVVRDGRVRVSGTVHEVDTERLEREVADGSYIWELDPRGAAVVGASVTARFVEIVRTRRQVGTEYDFIEKRVVPVYTYDYDERPAGSVRLTSDANGRFAGSVAAPSADGDYHVFLSATDPDGHVAGTSTSAGAVQARIDENLRFGPILGLTSGSTEEVRFGIGDTIDVTMQAPGDDDAGTHLFYLTQRGLRSASVQASARFRIPFPDWGPPNLGIGAVRFTGERYLVTYGYTALFRASDRAITVDLTSDRDRYAPGGRVELDVRTTDADGDPIAATVMVRVVDEKLFAINAAGEADPLGELYGWVSDGIRSTYASHRAPPPRPEGGDTTGGGGRDAFADAVLFQALETGSDGRGSVSFTLSDDLTAWRVSAAAVTAALDAGEGTLAIPVGLPFFVEIAMAPEYLASDRPSIMLRGYGSDLEASDQVTFDVRSESLGLDVTGLRAAAFQGVAVALPALAVGRHEITVTARTGSGAAARSDTLTRSVEVVESRLTRTDTTFQELTGPTAAGVGGGRGFTEVVVTDAGSGRYLPLLLDLSAMSSIRLERALGADLAAALLVERFESDMPPTLPFDPGRYQVEDGGLAVVPHASSDLEATVLAALVAGDRFDRASMAAYFRSVIDDEAVTRERRNLAIAGLGGLGEGVLSEIRTALGDADLTVRERLWLALGAVALGDAGTGRQVAADLVAAATESFGATARLRAGADRGDVTAGTALLAMLLAGVGDPVAARFWAYVEANPATDTTTELHAIGVITATLDWSAPVGVRFVSIVSGERTAIDLDPGETYHLRLTPAQAATFAIEPVEGRIGLTTAWRAATSAADVQADPDLTIVRRVEPAGTIGSGDLVTVDLLVTFGARAPEGCHLVTDLVPSGLTPVGVRDGWIDPDTGEEVRGITYPMEQVGQRVAFCAEQGVDGVDGGHLRYVARVVTAGTYTWEPAVVESRTDPERATLTPTTTIVID